MGETKISILPIQVYSDFGCYNPDYDEIFMSEWIYQKHPEYYEKILEHELNHAKIFKSGAGFWVKLWRNIRLEYTDFVFKMKLLNLHVDQKNSVENRVIEICITYARLPEAVIVTLGGVLLRVWGKIK